MSEDFNTKIESLKQQNQMLLNDVNRLKSLNISLEEQVKELNTQKDSLVIELEEATEKINVLSVDLESIKRSQTGLISKFGNFVRKIIG
ncbi:MAG: hypothetical protein Q9M91_08705 [Candidatus Dojkabacteria bacterium]|nr:hypothetical protein [Candidatus Dojkabacteria bacterium]MDQ7021852.1 hypothetical protein [Candidatus Dojkabacteria bacterium]